MSFAGAVIWGAVTEALLTAGDGAEGASVSPGCENLIGGENSRGGASTVIFSLMPRVMCRAMAKAPAYMAKVRIPTRAPWPSIWESV